MHGKQIFVYHEEQPSDFIYMTMLALAFSFIGFGFLSGTPMEIGVGLLHIFKAQAGLVTDSIVVGGLGAAFVNAGLVTLVSVLLLRVNKLAFTGISVAVLFLMAGFALFGKDVFNIFPILMGGYLYAKYKRERFARYLYVSLFGTSLSPAVTEMATIAQGHPGLQITLMLGVGVLIGFLLPPIASYTPRIHQGYNLYNVGFASGMIGMVLASFCKSLGYTFVVRMEWSSGNNMRLACFLITLFVAMIGLGFWYNGRTFRGYLRIMRHSGRTVADFVLLDGYPITLINMGVVGICATLYVLAVRGVLNGPTIGGIMTICGFGAFGKHPRNMAPVVLGVALSSLLTVWQLNDPMVLLAALFSTALAPIAGQFGWKWGIAAGAMHASVVLNVTNLHGGLNLYNNGFSAGLVCIVLVPLVEALRKGE